MELPYTGRAIINDTFNDFEITIPTKKNWFLIIFLGAWLGGWAMGEIFALGALIGFIENGLGAANLFILFWLCGWTAGGFFAIKTFLWNLIGKEIITFGPRQLTIAKRGFLFTRPKTYDLQQVKKLRVKEEEDIYEGFMGSRKNLAGLNVPNGTIRFDYGLQTVKFANGIDEAEANHILNTLKAKRLIHEHNL